MSADLQWLFVRNNSSFLLKNKAGKRATFTTEPYNLVNKNSFKYNTLVNKKGVGVSAGPDNKGVVLFTKRKGGRKPAMVVRRTIQYDRRRTYRTIRKYLGSCDYRQDLMEVAVRRASAILASQRPRKRILRRRR